MVIACFGEKLAVSEGAERETRADVNPRLINRVRTEHLRGGYCRIKKAEERIKARDYSHRWLCELLIPMEKPAAAGNIKINVATGIEVNDRVQSGGENMHIAPRNTDASQSCAVDSHRIIANV